MIYHQWSEMDIKDSSAWWTTVAFFEELEVVSCGEMKTLRDCSLCIRRHMSYKSQCPTCFEDTSEPYLRNNRILDDLLEKFKELVIQLSSVKLLAKKSSTPEKMRLFTSPSSRGSAQEPPTFKEHMSPLPREESSSAHVTTVTKKNGEGKGTSLLQSFMSPPSHSKKKRYLEETIVAASVTNAKEESQTVTCPVCSVPVPSKNINLHLDNCLKRQEASNNLVLINKMGVVYWATIEGKEDEKRKPMPKLVYRLLPDKELRKRLHDLGLSDKGDRKALINRHHRFTLLYNSECDKLNPKSVQQIVAEVEREESQLRRINDIFTSSASNSHADRMNVDRNSDSETIAAERQRYMKNHSSHFSHLIAQAREHHLAEKRRREQEQSKWDPDAPGPSGLGRNLHESFSEEGKEELRGEKREEDDEQVTSSEDIILSQRTPSPDLFAEENIISTDREALQDGEEDVVRGKGKRNLVKSSPSSSSDNFVDGLSLRGKGNRKRLRMIKEESLDSQPKKVLRGRIVR
ncbi:unnamed protein product [Darwinula stevensoni]|uniref:RING-type E3 ubiquitin transferase n=1 Tax=Darwinula stevensoni TaxID=69355 RepID=A0A7R8WXN3_9CRUS|nr:unnamed protein product [Darwinula stevensoni]CAG0878553.1 unnamed protein product [Darwinula stevensoni]